MVEIVPPSRIRPDHPHAVMLIDWPDGRAVALGLTYLRGECRCAMCVHEVTGERLIDPNSIPEDIQVREMNLVGNYALKILWSDGHDTGLYTWERLNELCSKAA
jgi:DUF971 family protein